ncbi:unnamed protein product [Diplocarpon coronariae]
MLGYHLSRRAKHFSWPLATKPRSTLPAPARNPRSTPARSSASLIPLQLAKMPDFSPDRFPPPPLGLAATCTNLMLSAGSGIGLAVARQLVIDGLRRIALVDLSADSLDTATTALRSLASPTGPVLELRALPADCSRDADVEAAVAATVDAFGRVDVCFNAAGVSGEFGGTAATGVEDLDRVLGLNLRGAWLCERAQIRQFLKQEMRDVRLWGADGESSTGLPFQTRGSIVNVGSLASHRAIPSLSPYIMAKHGVLGLTKADASDYAKDGIRVNCLCPGWIATNMTKRLVDGDSVAVSMGSEMNARAPMARWGKPEEVAFVACFLLSDKASFVTGTSVSVDGGYLAC